jgi:Winged helix DNA-binding domain
LTVNLVAHRLWNQLLTGPGRKRPQEVVAWMGAMQAQDYAGARWAIGLRLRGITDEQVERAFDGGAILRTHMLRPTWHFVTPADIRWIQALAGPRVHVANAFAYRTLQIDSKAIATSRRVLERSLAGGNALTRLEIRDAFRAAGLQAEGQRLAYLVMHAELEAVICSGPRRGKQFTYMLLDERVPRAAALSTEEALAGLTRRYFTSHGPATLRDYVWWSGLTARQAREGIALTGDALVEHQADGLTYWLAPPKREAPRRAPAAFLLPNYDEFGIAYKDRGLIIDERDPRDRRNPAMTGAEFAHLLIVNGRLRGSWRRGGVDPAVELRLYRPLARSESPLVRRAIESYTKFLRLSC